MSVNSISAFPVLPADATKAKPRANVDAIAIATPSASDTVSISAEAWTKSVDVANDSGLTQEMKNAALPDWLAAYYPKAPTEIGMSALAMDAMNARFNSLSESELAQYYTGIQTHYQEALRSLGLENNPDRFDLLKASKELDNQLRSAFEQRVASDDELFSLMSKMGQ